MDSLGIHSDWMLANRLLLQNWKKKDDWKDWVRKQLLLIFASRELVLLFEEKQVDHFFRRVWTPDISWYLSIGTRGIFYWRWSLQDKWNLLVEQLQHSRQLQKDSYLSFFWNRLMFRRKTPNGAVPNMHGTQELPNSKITRSSKDCP